MAARLAAIPCDRPIMAICQGGVRSLRAAQFLCQVGYNQVASVHGGTAAWLAAGKPTPFGDTTLQRPAVTESAWTHAGMASVG